MRDVTPMRNVDRFTPGAPDAGRQRGAALVELAIALPLLVVILVGTIDFGRAFRTAMIVTNAARAGAQYGSQSTARYTDHAGMTAAADAVLSSNGLSTGSSSASHLCQCVSTAGVYTDTSPANTCSASCGGGHITVRVTVTAQQTFSTISPFPGVPSTVSITRGATVRAQ